jgi:tetratricopeptide (TPR) repeat protein
MWSSPDTKDMSLASDFLDAKDYKKALMHYTKVVRRNQNKDLAIKAAQEASRVAMFELKEYQASIQYFEFLILQSHSAQERKDSQLQIAKIYFEHIADYQKAIEEFSKLLTITTDVGEITNIHLYIAKSYFYMKQFEQALSETEQLPKESVDSELKYSVDLLRANIYLSMNKVNEAVNLYLGLLKDYPKKAVEDQIGMNISVCYEELGRYNEAIQVLKDVRASYTTPEFVDIRIKRLLERQQLQPGAKGLKK